jgi:hypothetical protein
MGRFARVSGSTVLSFFTLTLEVDTLFLIEKICGSLKTLVIHFVMIIVWAIVVATLKHSFNWLLLAKEENSGSIVQWFNNITKVMGCFNFSR